MASDRWEALSVGTLAVVRLTPACTLAGETDVVYDGIGGGHSVPSFERPSLLRRIVAGVRNRDIDGASEIWASFECQVESRSPERKSS